jgi:ACT domain-containing protein
MQINRQTIGCLSLTIMVLEVASGFDLSLEASQKYHLTVDQLRDFPQNQRLTVDCCIVDRVTALASMLLN